MLKQLQEISNKSHKHKIDPKEAINIEMKFMENMLCEIAKRGGKYYTFYHVIYPIFAKIHFESMGLKTEIGGRLGENLTIIWE